MPFKPTFYSSRQMRSGTFAMLLALGCLMAACSSCSDHSRTVESKESMNASKQLEENIRRNQNWVEEERKQIDAFIAGKGWDMKRTDTGLRYLIYEAGAADGPNGAEGFHASVAYEITLLDGSACYKAGADDPKQFVIGFANVESGIHEVMTYLRAGDKARVVLPAHLAFGLTGDNDKIPPRAAVVYDLHVLGLNKP